MNYALTDYQGKEITITPEQAAKIAGVAELIEVTVNSQTHYLNPKNIASIKPVQGINREADRAQLERMTKLGQGIHTDSRVQGRGLPSSF